MKTISKALSVLLAVTLAFAMLACNEKPPKTPTPEKLGTPSGITYAQGELSWTAVTGATSYAVTVTEQGKTEKKLTKSVGETKVDVSSVGLGSYTVSIVAKADGKTDSDAGTADFKIEAYKLKAPVVKPDAAFSTLTWEEVANSDGYQVIVKKGTETVAETDEGTIRTSLDIRELSVGTYTVTAQTFAFADDELRSDSDIATTTFEIKALGEYEQISNLRIEGGYFVWDANNAADFEIKVTDKDSNAGDVDLGSVKASNNSFMIAGTGIPAGGYTFSVTPKDNRHTGTGTPATKDFTLTELANWDVDAIAAFDGNAPVGEHAKVEKVEHNGHQIAKVTPTADGWGRVGSPSVNVDFTKNPVVFVDIDGLEIGGYHVQMRVGGSNYQMFDDHAGLDDNAIGLLHSVDPQKDFTAADNGAVNIRLGVDNSTTTTANDAVAYYNSVRLMQITDYEAPFQGEIAGKTNITVGGQTITWTAVEHANQYKITLTGDALEAPVAATVKATEYSVRDLEEGEYKIEIVASSSNPGVTDSTEKASVEFTVKYLASYSGHDFDTTVENAKFTKGSDYGYHDGMAKYDEEEACVVINQDGSRDYGAIAPKEGVKVNFANSPFVVVDVKFCSTGYLAGHYYDSKTTAAINDTDPPATQPFRVYKDCNRDNNDNVLFGEYDDYRFMFGFRGGSSEKPAKIGITAMRIVEITEKEDLTVPETPVALAAPAHASEAKGVLTAQPVKGNSVYTPTYSVKVTDNAGNAQVVSLVKQAAPQIDLGNLGLTSGHTYTVTFVAEGDNRYFANSPEYKVSVAYDEKKVITDFSTLDFDTMEEKNGGDLTACTPENGKLTLTAASGAWGFAFFNIEGVVRSELEEYYLQTTFDLNATTEGATLASRFLKPDEDNKVVDTGYGERVVKGGNCFLTKEWNDKIQSDGTVWFALGFGGASAGEETKTIVVTSIKFVRFVVSDIA